MVNTGGVIVDVLANHPSAKGERGGTGGGVAVTVFAVVVVALLASAAVVVLQFTAAAVVVALDAGGSCRQVPRSSSRWGAFCSMLAVFR